MDLEKGFYASPRWTYEILDCAMPMTFDTYSNCAHQCLYCFSFFQRAIGNTADDYLHHKVRAVNVDRIKAMFLDPDNNAGQFKNYIKRRMTLQWGGLSDGFDWYERKFRKSLELLEFFRAIDYPISVSTKGVWWVYDEDYRKVVKGAKNMHWKYSIITSIEEHVKALEPGTPTARERFAAMRELNNLGVGATTLRFRPYVLGTSDLCMEEMLELAKAAGCLSVTTEFLTWESRASNTSRARLDAMSKVLGYDVWDFYTKNSARASGLLRLNYDLKRPYIKAMKEKAEELGLYFFVSDAHHKEDSYHAGCCGLPEDGPLSNVNRGQYAHAIKLAKENGFVQWSDISEEAFSLLNDIPLYQAEGFPSDSVERAKRRYQSMFDYMHDVWNNPQSWQSPARYFGGALVPSAPDEHGDIIYLYNKPFIEEGLRVASVNELAVLLRMSGKPNADRYDDMTKDGGDFGHVAYPVYVFSKGRADCATTPHLLEKARLSNWSLVVPEDEVEEYTAHFPHADILAVPVKGGGMASVREWVYQAAKEEGYPYIWMLDDDITAFQLRYGDECSPRAVFSGVERFAESYTNIALLGIPDSGDLVAKDFEQNRWTFKAVYLVNMQTGISFAGGEPVLEMVEFALRNMEDGKWTSVIYNGYRAKIRNDLHGGASSLYLHGLQKRAAGSLIKRFHYFVEAHAIPAPFYIALTESNHELVQNSLMSRAVVELLEDNDAM